MEDKKPEDFFATRPPAETRGQQFKKFLWNPSTHELLGRTATSWFQILAFYVVLYAFLAGFFASLLLVFYQTLDESKPTWQLDSSRIGSNPGMGYRPVHPDPDVAVISFDKNDEANVKMWKEAVDSFFKPYYDAPAGDYEDCQYGREPSTEKPCRFPVPTSVNCSEQNSYGFKDNSPCFYLKLNKIYGWKPDPYSREDIMTNAMKMPEDLKNKILGLSNEMISNNVWVSCSGDAEILGETSFEYIGHMGFPSYYYPYANQKGYRAPFVVLQISNLPKGTMVRLTCQLWAKNVFADRQRRLGLTNIEILAN
jgi:sodium/potassium-transporting ATPase subunit beta